MYQTVQRARLELKVNITKKKKKERNCVNMHNWKRHRCVYCKEGKHYNGEKELEVFQGYKQLYKIVIWL